MAEEGTVGSAEVPEEGGEGQQKEAEEVTWAQGTERGRCRASEAGGGARKADQLLRSNRRA